MQPSEIYIIADAESKQVVELDGLQPDHQEGQQKEPEPGLLDPGVWVYDPAGGGWVWGWAQHRNIDGEEDQLWGGFRIHLAQKLEHSFHWSQNF